MLPSSQRLRILQTVPSFGLGGAENMAGHLMIGLSESFDIVGATLYDASYSSIESRLKDANIPLWHLGKRTGFDPRMFSAFDRILEKVRPHVVHTHLSVLRYALPALLRRRIPLVVHTLHNMAEHETDAVGRFIQWFAFRGIVLPVAISQKVASSFRNVYGLACKTIIPNCIPVGDYRSNPEERIRWRVKEGFDQDAILFACVGRLEPQKNPLMLVRAFAALNHPRTHLLFFGDGTLQEDLSAYINGNRLQGSVHLLGKRSSIAKCLAASDVFVLSSDWEGNPLAVMEAMAAGLPVISTAVGGVPELVQSGVHGLLVPPGDCGGFTDAMRTLLHDPEQRAAMASAACARASTEFNLEQMAQGYASLYRTALSATRLLRVSAA